MTILDGRNGFFQLLGGSSIGRGLSFGINILLSRALGPTELGIFTLILSTSQTFEVLSRGGVDYGVTCALTQKGTIDGFENDQQIINTAIRVVRYISLVLLIILLTWLGPGGGILPNTLTISRNLAIILTSVICVTESLSGLPWDILLAKGKVNVVRLRQGLFTPLKLIAGLIGAWAGGIVTALACYVIMAGLQAVWLNKKIDGLGGINVKAKIRWGQLRKLAGDGMPLYISNSLSALVFLPLLARIAAVSGLESVGYLRSGQILVQLFTLIPGALAPILFIKTRTSDTERKKNIITEQSLIMIWGLGVTTLLSYIAIDRQLINFFFGSNFLDSVQPTRLLIYITIIDSIGQVLYTSLLAKGQTKLFIIVQNSALLLAALLGWLLIPAYGLNGFLLSKFIYAALPGSIYLMETWSRIENKSIICVLTITSLLVLPLCWTKSIATTVELVLICMQAILITWSALKFRSYMILNKL